MQNKLIKLFIYLFIHLLFLNLIASIMHLSNKATRKHYVTMTVVISISVIFKVIKNLLKVALLMQHYRNDGLLKANAFARSFELITNTVIKALSFM